MLGAGKLQLAQVRQDLLLLEIERVILLVVFFIIIVELQERMEKLKQGKGLNGIDRGIKKQTDKSNKDRF